MEIDDIPNEVGEETLSRALRRVLEAEDDKLHMKRPHGINQEIKAIIEDEVK